jgi:hypothetical protein
MTAAMDHDGCRSNRRGPQWLGQQPWTPHGCESQPPLPTAVKAYSPCATAAGLAVVGHSGRGCATIVGRGGRSGLPYKKRKLARKCHKIWKKEREGREGEEIEGAE